MKQDCLTTESFAYSFARLFTGYKIFEGRILYVWLLYSFLYFSFKFITCSNYYHFEDKWILTSALILISKKYPKMKAQMYSL